MGERLTNYDSTCCATRLGLFLNKNLAKSETTNKSAEIKNRIRAASVAQRSKPPKPYIPVITAIIKKGSVNRFIIECFCV